MNQGRANMHNYATAAIPALSTLFVYYICRGPIQNIKLSIIFCMTQYRHVNGCNSMTFMQIGCFVQEKEIIILSSSYP